MGDTKKAQNNMIQPGGATVTSLNEPRGDFFWTAARDATGILPSGSPQKSSSGRVERGGFSAEVGCCLFLLFSCPTLFQLDWPVLAQHRGKILFEVDPERLGGSSKRTSAEAAGDRLVATTVLPRPVPLFW